MEVTQICLALILFLIGLTTLYTNRARRLANPHFELQPNCLLTRWPLLLVTGPRSVFYFSAYWNIYSSYLAEHGYEVFTLHLPWRDTKLRKKYFESFLQQQEKNGKHFHFIMDAATLTEFSEFIRNSKSSAIISLTEIKDEKHPAQIQLSAFPLPSAEIEMLASKKANPLLRLTYKLHKLVSHNKELSSLSSLGACPSTALANAGLLLERARTLAEMDLRES